MAKQEVDVLAFSTFKDTWRESQDMMEKIFDLHDEFQWLDEIFPTACSAFTVKSKKLEQMPKTPSAKNKMQNRKRKKEDLTNIEEEPTLRTAKMRATRLKFEDQVEEQIDDSESLNMDRPVRKCRASKNVTKAKAAPKKLRGKKQAEEFRSSVEMSTGLSPEKTQQTQQNGCAPAKTDLSEIDKRLSEAPVSSTKANALQVANSGRTDDSSPSVKTRVRDYENRILTPQNQSGTKDTPSKALAETHAGSNKKSGQGVGPAGSKMSPFLTNEKKSRQGSRKLDKESLQDSPALKQTRTRLRLKKIQQNEPAIEASTDAERKVQKQTDTKNDSKAAYSSTEPGSSEDSDKADSDTEIIDSSLDNQKSPGALPGTESLSDTQVVISEVYELSENGREAKLQKYEEVKTKTTPCTKVSNMKDIQHQLHSSSDLTVSDDYMETDSSSSKDEPQQEAEETSRGMSIRTRTRVKPTTESAKKVGSNKDSGVIISDKVNSTFTTGSESGSDDGIGRSTRTRTRVQKEKDATVTTTDTAVEEPVRTTRTRQRAQDKEAAAKAAEGTKQGSQKTTTAAQNRSKAQFMVDGKDEKISGSPAVEVHRSPFRGAKRVIEHGRGLSPAPKRARSNMGEDLLNAQPLSTSSPIKNLDESELRDRVPSASRAPQPFKFTSVQRNVSSFLNRTPGSSQNMSRLISFINTPNSAQLLNGTRTTFLSKASPSPQRGPQSIFDFEKRKKQLAEKENKEKERMRKYEEKRKQDLEKRKRDREERFQRAAALRQEQEEKKRQQEEQYMKRLGTTTAKKAKMQEDREREESEKRKQRQKKQIEAELRRKQEEEDRKRRILEQEEEARQQEMLFLKKRKQEELLRKQRVAEEKTRNEERLAEKEQRFQEEKAKALHQQRERELMADKARVDKEHQILQERLEKERIEKDRKAEKEKKLKEELERLKAMEQERLYLREQELQNQKEIAAKERELKQIISNHNKSILTQKQQGYTSETVPCTSQAPSGVLNTTQTLNTSKTLNTTQTLNTSKMVTTSVNNSTSYEMTPAKIYTSNSKSDYGLDDKESDDSTDDEEAPKKKIPDWAMGINLNTALIKQCTNPPDLDEMFRFSAITPPDLEKIFKGNLKKRYKQRTSSAIWNTPPLKYC